MRTVPSVSISFGLAPPPPPPPPKKKKTEKICSVFTRNDAAASIKFTTVEGGDNSSYAGSEAREVFINTSSDISGVNK